jgi:two-component system, OmpR family, phosphate regulon response regulator PhoB
MINTGRMLVVESDQVLASRLASIFCKENFEISQTDDGHDAVLRVREAAPDIILLDWSVDGLAGIEICRRLRRLSESSAVPIIMFANGGGEEDRVRSLETGADDCLSKPFTPRELVARVNAVLRRTRPALAGETLVFGDLVMETETRKVYHDGRSIPLTNKEYMILRHFMEYPDRIFSRENLLDLFWRSRRDVTDRSVDVSIRRLRMALEAAGCPDMIQTVRSVGYKLNTDNCTTKHVSDAPARTSVWTKGDIFLRDR